jgi:hypothetical protein
MREDILDVITEPARSGSSYRKERKGYKKRLQKHGLDVDLRESMGMRGRNFDWDSNSRENLKPIEGFLHKSVGRPWGEVCKEIDEVMPAWNPLSGSYGDRFLGMVETATQEVNGEILDSKGFPLGNYSWRPRYYVCPKGYLREVKSISYKHKWKKYGSEPWFQKNERGEWLIFDKWDTQCWFACRMVPYVPTHFENTVSKIHNVTWYNKKPVYPMAYDVMLKTSLGWTGVGPDTLRRHYGAPFYCAERRQIGKRQIKKYKLNG